MPTTTPNTIEPSSSHATASAVVSTSIPPPITALVSALASEKHRITQRSATTTEASMVDASGPSARVSASIAITTAGDCADSATPITMHTARLWPRSSESNSGSHGRIRNTANPIANIAPITANTVIARSVRSTGRILRSWSSDPASSARIAVAVVLTTLSDTPMSGVTSPST